MIMSVLVLLCSVERCDDCYHAHLEAMHLAQLIYENATIYVSKVAEVDRTIAHNVDSPAVTANGTNASNSASIATPTSEDYITVTDDEVLVDLG